VVGIVIVFMAKAADVTSSLEVWDTTIGELDGWSAVFLGLSLSSFAGVGYEVKKSLDNSDSTQQLSLTRDG
jgi:hypothetical protein